MWARRFISDFMCANHFFSAMLSDSRHFLQTENMEEDFPSPNLPKDL